MKRSEKTKTTPPTPPGSEGDLKLEQVGRSGDPISENKQAKEEFLRFATTGYLKIPPHACDPKAYLAAVMNRVKKDGLNEMDIADLACWREMEPARQKKTTKCQT